MSFYNAKQFIKDLTQNLNTKNEKFQNEKLLEFLGFCKW